MAERASTVLLLLRGFLMAPHDDTPAMLLCRLFRVLTSRTYFFLAFTRITVDALSLVKPSVIYLYVDMFVTLPVGNVENYMHTKNI